MTDQTIAVHGLAKQFQRSKREIVRAVDDVSISVASGELLVLLGPSGCGKSTLLRCLAGLEEPDSGQIDLNGKRVYSAVDRVSLPPEKRDAAMLFQSYALWPHMKVFDNVAYPLRADPSIRARKPEVSQRVHEMLDLVECGHLAAQYPGQVSGGQQQRIALARALVRGNPVVFFDEPLSNVDARLRDQLRLELKLLQRRLGFSAIYVTHDQAEALALADRVIVLQEGAIAQVGTPQEVYDRPASAYVARFMGTMNELPGTVARSASGGLEVDTNMGRASLPADVQGYAPGDSVIVMARPADCELTEAEPDEPLRYKVLIRAPLYLGTHVEVAVEPEDGSTHTVRLPKSRSVTAGHTMWLSFPSAKLTIVAEGSAHPSGGTAC